MRVEKEAVFAFPEAKRPGKALAEALGVPFHPVNLHHFPDGESLVRVPGAARRAHLYRTLDHPNPKLFEVVLALSALRDNGAKHITLVAPYLPYMRQDKVFRPGQALSQRVLGRLLLPWVDAVVAADPHLHRTASMETVFPGRRSAAVSGGKALARHFKENGIDKASYVLGPDEEAHHYARPFAESLGLKWGCAEKKRRGDREVEVTLPDNADVKGRPVLIVDDIASSGMTVVEAARAAKKAGAKKVSAAVSHALHDEAAAEKIKKAGVASLISCDGVPHPSNAVSLAPELAAAIRGL